MDTPKQVDMPKGLHNTVCDGCRHTCHKICIFADNNDKERCSAMDSNGYCKRCPGKCHWKVHKNYKYYYEWVWEEHV